MNERPAGCQIGGSALRRGPVSGSVALLTIFAGMALPGLSQANAAPPAQPTGLSVNHRSGQTFITWNERTDLSSERYHVYRHTSPITATNIGQATRLTERWGAVGEGSSKFWSERSREPPMTPNYVITDDGSPLSDRTGLYVWTTGQNGTYYYAVTTVLSGSENRVDFSSRNTSGAISEQVADPKPVRVWRASSGRGFVFTQYLDQSSYNPTFGAPRGSNAQQAAFNYGVTLPSADACGGSLPERLPADVYLEGWGERYANRSETPYDWCVVDIYIDDPNQTWYYGHSATYDYRNGGTADTGPIVNYTEERILRAIYDTLRDSTFRLDSQRIFIHGHSMGGSGALALGMRYPNVFAAVYSSEGMTNYRAATQWLEDTEWKWGTVARNLKTENRGPKGWASELACHDGTGVWDWQNHQEQLVARRSADTAYISLAHGRQDDVIPWDTQGRPAYKPFYSGRHTFSGAIVNEDHTWIGFNGLSPNAADRDGNPFYGWRFRRDETVPALSNASGSLKVPPSTTGSFNTNLEWSSSWHGWDDAPVDREGEWRISLRSRSGTQKVDVTPRRLKNFQVTPGAGYTWQNLSIASGNVVASGAVRADGDGLITVPAVRVTRSGNRLSIIPSGNRVSVVHSGNSMSADPAGTGLSDTQNSGRSRNFGPNALPYWAISRSKRPSATGELVAGGSSTAFEAKDCQGPRLRVRATKTTIRHLKRTRKIRLRVKSNEAATVRVKVSMATSRRGKRGRYRVVGKKRLTFTGAQTRRATLRLTRRGLKILRRRPYRRIRIVARARDLAGNRSTRTTRLRLRGRIR